MKNLLCLTLLFTSYFAFARTANDVYRMPSSGNIPGWGTLAKPSLPSVGQQISSSSGSFNNNTNAEVDVTNMSVSITTTGRPVMIFAIPADGSGGADTGRMGVDATATTTVTGEFYLDRAGSNIATWEMRTSNGSATGTDGVWVPCGSAIYLDVVAAGTYTYKWRAKSGASMVIYVTNCKLVAFEL